MQQKTKTTVWMETQTFIFFSSYIEPVPKFFKKKKKKKDHDFLEKEWADKGNTNQNER